MAETETPADTRMSLGEHLTELRSRLFKATLATLALGGASLYFARPIFGLLMRPVLEALPVGQRALIYTSGIEEINVLMKVGLYCGVFLSMPVLLWQLWGFISPGLYPSERRYASPFVVFGSLAFLSGGLFCYFAVLPSMFKFLLQSPEAAALVEQLDAAKLKADEAERLLRFGEFDRAADLAKNAIVALAAEGTAHAGSGDEVSRPAEPGVEISARFDGLGRLVDAVHSAVGPSSRPVLRKVMDQRLVAAQALATSDFTAASKAMDAAAQALTQVAPINAAELATIWSLEKALAEGRASYEASTWTRPMLTMREQLSLVLLLELAFGVIFELPLVLAVLGMAGIVRSSFLFKYQRHAFVICLIGAALITPTGDAVNLALMAGPMLLCYELGVLAVWLLEKRRPKIDPASGLPAA